jgi:hypothetical protein
VSSIEFTFQGDRSLAGSGSAGHKARQITGSHTFTVTFETDSLSSTPVEALAPLKIDIAAHFSMMDLRRNADQELARGRFDHGVLIARLNGRIFAARRYVRAGGTKGNRALTLQSTLPPAVIDSRSWCRRTWEG